MEVLRPVDGSTCRSIGKACCGAGMHYGLQRAVPGALVVRAFDLNELANDVYERNFSVRPWQASCVPIAAGSLLTRQASP